MYYTYSYYVILNIHHYCEKNSEWNLLLIIIFYRFWRKEKSHNLHDSMWTRDRVEFLHAFSLLLLLLINNIGVRKELHRRGVAKVEWPAAPSLSPLTSTVLLVAPSWRTLLPAPFPSPNVPSTSAAQLFLGGSSIAPNHPHLPSCLSLSP